MITQKRLKELFNYHRDGFFINKTLRSNRGAKIGEIIKGDKNKSGYAYLYIDWKNYKYHRMIFLWHYGYLPKYLDHKNRIRNDNKIEKWAMNQNEQYNWVHQASPEVTKFGATYGGIALGGIAVLSAAFKHKKGVETSLLATQALITSGIWIRLLKLAAGRERPYSSTATGSERGKQWYGPLPLYDKTFVDRKALEAFDSFPSGHTDVAFSIATVFAEQYNDTPVVPIISYSIATLVGLSRLTEHQHWSSDVFVSSIIGYACGKQVVNHFKKMQASGHSTSLNRKTKATYSLIQNGNQIGIAMKW